MEGLGVACRLIVYLIWIRHNSGYCTHLAYGLNTHCGAICVCILSPVAMADVVRTTWKYANAPRVSATSGVAVL